MHLGRGVEDRQRSRACSAGSSPVVGRETASASTRRKPWVPRATSTRSEPVKVFGQGGQQAGVGRLPCLGAEHGQGGSNGLTRDLGIIGQVQAGEVDVADDRFVLEPEELAELCGGGLAGLTPGGSSRIRSRRALARMPRSASFGSRSIFVASLIKVSRARSGRREPSRHRRRSRRKRRPGGPWRGLWPAGGSGVHIAGRRPPGRRPTRRPGPPGWRPSAGVGSSLRPRSQKGWGGARIGSPAR